MGSCRHEFRRKSSLYDLIPNGHWQSHARDPYPDARKDQDMPTQSAELVTLTRAHLVGIVAGNILEFYDFTLYAFFASQIGASMFVHGPGGGKGDGDGLLPALATFAVGFIARPIGALVIGRYADRRGRKPAMVLSFALMGVALLAVALAPPARMLGAWSAVIMAVARLVQGFALGGEVGPTTALLIEAAPVGRRGLYGAWQIASQGLAVLVAGLVGLGIAAVLSPQALTEWGWRLAMLLGVVILPVGFHLRRMMPETLRAPAGDPDERAASALPLMRVAAIGLLLVLAGTVTTYTLQFLNTYTVSTLKLNPRLAFTATAVTGASMFAFGLLGGWLSDRIGRRPVIVVPRVVMLVLIWPVFSMILARPALGALTLGVFVMTSLYAMSTATASVCLAECFPRERRSTGYAMTYTLGVSVFGGGAQLGIAWLGKATGSQMMPAWWLLVASAIGIGAGLTMPMLPRARKTPDLSFRLDPTQ
jgi:MFS family permease